MEITCPFCFGKFKQDQVIFRANTGFTRNELDKMSEDSGFLLGPDNDSDMHTRKLFQCFDAEDSKVSDKLLDDKLNQFWLNRGGSNGFVAADPKWNYPHIDPADQERFDQMVTREPRMYLHPDEDGFVRDSSGFITRVIDRYSDPSIPMTRLCPHCHNPLPLPDYGKYPVISVGIVGITTAGKTVYLNQLLTKFATAMAKTNYRIGVSNLNTIHEVVSEGEALPGSTDTQTMRRPLAVNMLNKDNADEGITLVFYDIAGEHCVSAVDNEGKMKDGNGISKLMGLFIAHCDGLMFLIDPQQIPLFAGNSVASCRDKVANIQDVISKVTMIRTAANPDHPYWDGIPVAAVLTKSDLMRNQIDGDSLIFQHINYNDENTKDFMRDDFLQIHRYLNGRFRENVSTISDSMDTFPLRAYFAVSAITCGVESRFEKHKNIYILNKENERRFRDVKDWVEGWNNRDCEEQGHYRPCPVRAADGSEIRFDCGTKIEDDNSGNIVTEIYAECIQEDYVDRIELSLWSIANEINLVSYPVSNPNPRRIEEPLKWILWELGYLGPRFIKEVPEFPFFCTSRKRALIQDECDQRNVLNEKRFYQDYDEEVN